MKQGKVYCDLCGNEIVAQVTSSRTALFGTDSLGALKEQLVTDHPSEGVSESTEISYHCSNPKCDQLIGGVDDLTSYASTSDPDEFRLFKQLDILQDVIAELCRMQLQTDSLNASVVIRNTLKDLPQKLPIIIDMKRKMVEGDFIDKIDIKELFNRLNG